MALECLFDRTGDTPTPEALYTRLNFPAPPADRPYVYINMVSTVDGKIVVGKPHGPAKGVGGPTDQLLFRRLQRTANAVIIGSGTLRAGPVIYPPNLPRYVVTRTGDLPLENRFFETTPKQTFVIAPQSLPSHVQTHLRSVATLL